MLRRERADEGSCSLSLDWTPRICHREVNSQSARQGSSDGDQIRSDVI